MPPMPTSAPVARPRTPVRSQTKLILFALFLLMTALVMFMKNRQVFDPKSEIAEHFAPAGWFLVAHAAFGTLALVLGLFQLSDRLRARYLGLHRTLGYVYVASVFLAGPLAVPVALRTATPSLVGASCVQSLGWMLATVIGLYSIRLGNMQQHRRWMMRGYPFAMVFTVTRLIIPIPPILHAGVVGIEIVVWATVAAAAILPSIFLDWPRPLRSAR